jgi:hypothetical protein
MVFDGEYAAAAEVYPRGLRVDLGICQPELRARAEGEASLRSALRASRMQRANDHQSVCANGLSDVSIAAFNATSRGAICVDLRGPR